MRRGHAEKIARQCFTTYDGRDYLHALFVLGVLYYGVGNFRLWISLGSVFHSFSYWGFGSF